MNNIRIGTSAFAAAGWENAFYPAGMKPADYRSYYATKFNTVEVDSTFYRAPSVATVDGWERKTPPGFSLAAKLPQPITHEKVLQDCDEDLKHFLETMGLPCSCDANVALVTTPQDRHARPWRLGPWVFLRIPGSLCSHICLLRCRLCTGA